MILKGVTVSGYCGSTVEVLVFSFQPLVILEYGAPSLVLISLAVLPGAVVPDQRCRWMDSGNDSGITGLMPIQAAVAGPFTYVMKNLSLSLS